MNPKCPHLNCIELTSARFSDPKPRRTVRDGRFYRKSDSRWIDRYFCTGCRRGFSRATWNENFRQKKRRINLEVAELLNSGVTQRRAALLLRVNRKTIVRKFRLLACRSRREQETSLANRYRENRVSHVQFDDLETSEHSKYKPLSVTLAVEANTRKILGFQVSRMPPRGVTARSARKKYGPRADRRPVGWNRLMKSLKPLVREDALFESDENPHYPKFVKEHFPRATHRTHPGSPSSLGGQGELKAVGFDPLFSLNHTCAMLRANLSRLIRKTWSTTKTLRGLEDHLALYMDFHNRVLTS